MHNAIINNGALITTNSIVSGVLSLAQTLDRESTTKYVLNVSASDNGRHHRTAFQTIEILVDDVNDNDPEFEQRTYVANISENAPTGTFVIRVQASDRDIGETLSRDIFSIKWTFLIDNHSLMLVIVVIA